MAIIERQARNATVICCGDVLFGTLSGQEFLDILKEFERQKIEKNVKYFNQKLFQGCTYYRTHKISGLFEKKTFLRGHHLMVEGAPYREFMILKKGELLMTKKMNPQLVDFGAQHVDPNYQKLIMRKAREATSWTDRLKHNLTIARICQDE
jgi:hypothetical protein